MSKSGSNATRCLKVTKVSPISLAFVPSTTHLSPPFFFLRFDNATEQALSEGWGRFKSQINHLFLLPRPTRNSRLQRHYAHRSKRVHCNRLHLMLRQVLSETVPAPKPPKSVAKKTKKTKAPPPQTADTAFHGDELSKLKDRQGTPRYRHLPPDHRGATAETQTFCRTLLLKAYQILRWKKCSAIRGRGRGLGSRSNVRSSYCSGTFTT